MRTILFGAGFVVFCLGAFRWPILGIFGYMADYLVSPVRQWWGAPLGAAGVRFSFTFVLCIAGGMLVRWREIRARIPSPFWHSQEILVMAFAALVVLSRSWGVEIDTTVRDLPGLGNYPASKMPKVAVFVLMLTHLVTRYRQFNATLWVLVLVGGLYLGVDAYTAEAGRFVSGRLDVLGGADFADSSMVAAHLAFVGVVAGGLFLRSRRPWVKLLLIGSGIFAANAIILTQTRAAVVALVVGGVVAPLLAGKGQRLRVCAYLLIGGVGAFFLTNKEFWTRTQTITATAEEQDESAKGRPVLWKTAFAIFTDYPLGIGAGSIYTVMGRYNPQTEGRDCHNSYLCCGAELGVTGLALYAALMVNAFRTLRRAGRLAAGTPIEKDVAWDVFALQLALLIYFVTGIFNTLIYLEESWWFICLPVCLERAVVNARLEMESLADGEPDPTGDSEEVAVPAVA